MKVRAGNWYYYLGTRPVAPPAPERPHLELAAGAPKCGRSKQGSCLRFDLHSSKKHRPSPFVHL